MRILLVFVPSLVALMHCDASPQSDSVFVVISTDTVKVWNTGVEANCASQFEFSIASNNGNTFVVTERDTVKRKVRCICRFDLSVALPGVIPAGTNHVDVYRQYLTQYGYPSDTTVFIGSIDFTINVQRSTPVATFFQSECRNAVSVHEIAPPVPSAFRLYQCYPNPFNPSTTIRYSIGSGGWSPGSSWVRLSVYDVLGREVLVLVNERKDAGVYEVRLDATDLASGFYLYRIQSGTYTETKKLGLVR